MLLWQFYTQPFQTLLNDDKRSHILRVARRTSVNDIQDLDQRLLKIIKRTYPNV